MEEIRQLIEGLGEDCYPHYLDVPGAGELLVRQCSTFWINLSGERIDYLTGGLMLEIRLPFVHVFAKRTIYTRRLSPGWTVDSACKSIENLIKKARARVDLEVQLEALYLRVPDFSQDETCDEYDKFIDQVNRTSEDARVEIAYRLMTQADIDFWNDWLTRWYKSYEIAHPKE